ncbi:DUF397 domain-containing protein [Actinomadura logoneensis]|uniref:DUF397 domain-containing protein n=1 Tax=Actinomadura logoneensis TaxID=2293572 RepID=A0A372JPL0_9ACTN|nr:DUF397 domain-containing protein [Actinomadura logoneensis]RFU41268.1 DUF397 domain-containing protein [Actinomadura logoneensis]
MAWRKSSHSDEEVNCVEVARMTSTKLAIRDSKAPDDPALTLDRGSWLALRSKLSTTGLV